MILTAFLVVSARPRARVPNLHKAENVLHTCALLEFLSLLCTHTHLQFSGADSERLVLAIKHFLEGKGAYFPGKGHR